jgi:hypothetical protein
MIVGMKRIANLIHGLAQKTSGGRRRLARWAFTALRLAPMLVVFAPVIALAASDDEGPKPDARLEGYGSTVTLPAGTSGTSLLWIVFIILGILCISVLFKNAKRTHLD